MYNKSRIGEASNESKFEFWIRHRYLDCIIVVYQIERSLRSKTIMTSAKSKAKSLRSTSGICRGSRDSSFFRVA